jgi:hypothetical protein
MDINSLPVVYHPRPVTTTIKANRPAAADDSAPRVERVAVRPRSTRTFDDAMQGELLQRQRDNYQSTRAFIDERNLNQAHTAGAQTGNARQARSAILEYANHVRPEPRAELTQGVSVNYFV